MLLLLITGQRGQSIHLLKVEDVIFHVNSLELQFSLVLKHTRHGVHHDNIMLQSYFQNKLLCTLSLVREYIDSTSSLRGQETRLFILTHPPLQERHVQLFRNGRKE